MNCFMPIRCVRRHARTALFVLALSTAGGTWVSAQSQDTSVVRLPNIIVHNGLPRTLHHATLFGDSSTPWLYVYRIKFAPGTKVMPHWHPDAVRTVLVLSGRSTSPSVNNGTRANSRLILLGRCIPN